MGERAEPHALVVGAGDHRRVCAVEAPADAVVAGVDSAAGRHGGGGAEGERVHEKRNSGGWLCTRHALLTPHDSESNQSGRSTRIACFFQAFVSRWIRLVSRWIWSESHQSGRSTRIGCFFQALVSRWIWEPTFKANFRRTGLHE